MADAQRPAPRTPAVTKATARSDIQGIADALRPERPSCCSPVLEHHRIVTMWLRWDARWRALQAGDAA